MVQAAFLLIVLLSFLLFYIGTGFNRFFLWLSCAWLLMAGAAAGSEFFLNTAAFPPRFMAVIAGAITFVILANRSIDPSKAKIPILIAVHIIRIPVELILYHLYLERKVPLIMTFKGWNYDVVMGISALAIFLYIFRKHRIIIPFLITWNIVGIIFLAIIVVIAILSAPSPIQQLAFEQPNVALLAFPFTLLPAFIVPVVLLSHIITLRALKRS